MRVPSFMLKKLYVSDSLAPTDDGGFQFKLKNTLATATITEPPEVSIDGTPVPVTFHVDGESIRAEDVSDDETFELTKGLEVRVTSEESIGDGAHSIHIKAETDEFDTLDFEVEDTL